MKLTSDRKSALDKAGELLLRAEEKTGTVDFGDLIVLAQQYLAMAELYR